VKGYRECRSCIETGSEPGLSFEAVTGSIGIVLGMMLAALWRDSIDVDFLTQKHENKINIDVAGVHPPGSQIP